MSRLPAVLTFAALGVIASLLINLNGCAGASSSKHTAAVGSHVMIIFQENRTPDNLFQGLCIPPYGSASACGTGQNQYDIASSGLNSSGQTIPLTPIDLGTNGIDPDYYDVAHSHGSFEDLYDGGKMDGENLAPLTCNVGIPNCPPNPVPPNYQYRYVNPADVAPYIQMAQQWTWGNRMFQTNEGPSFPAHQFISCGHISSDGYQQLVRIVQRLAGHGKRLRCSTGKRGADDQSARHNCGQAISLL